MTRHEEHHERSHSERRETKGSFFGKDRGEFANMPKDVEMKEFPKNKYIDKWSLDDTIDGIDDMRNDAIVALQKEIPDSKW